MTDDRLNDFTTLGESLAMMAEAMRELDRTLLLGWPHDELPTETEAHQIEAIFHEIGMYQPGMSETMRWRIAGTCVARFRLPVDQGGTR